MSPRRRPLACVPCLAGIVLGHLVACSLFVDTGDLEGTRAPADGGDRSAIVGDGPSPLDGAPAEPSDGGGSDAAASAYRNEVLADAPLLYLALDEATGPLAKDEVNALSASYIGAVEFGAPGAIANSPRTGVRLRGGRISVTRRVAFPGLAPYTIEAWIRPDTIDNGYRRIVSRELGSPRNGYGLFLNSDVGIAAERHADGGTNAIYANSLPPTDRYTHVVATFDGSKLRLYFDGGEPSGPASTTLPIADRDGELAIGSYAGGNSNAYSGLIDEVAIYPTALSAVRIQAHFNRGRGQ